MTSFAVSCFLRFLIHRTLALLEDSGLYRSQSSFGILFGDVPSDSYFYVLFWQSRAPHEVISALTSKHLFAFTLFFSVTCDAVKL